MASQREPTVLVVDDEILVCRIACAALERHGFCVAVANDAMEGLRRFADHRESLDIVVSDVSMPGMSGPEMVLKMRRERPHLNVLFISGRDDLLPDWIEETCGLLMKPFFPHQFVAAVQDCLGIVTK
jgi:two-component system cell cycle sensor histidine kinase/response regulator CckA